LALSGASVTLYNNNSGEQQWSQTTGSDGYTSYEGATYYFYNSTGEYNYSTMSVSVSKSGYTSTSVESLVISGQTTISVSWSQNPMMAPRHRQVIVGDSSFMDIYLHP
jgi:hypothetical protein